MHPDNTVVVQVRTSRNATDDEEDEEEERQKQQKLLQNKFCKHNLQKALQICRSFFLYIIKHLIIRCFFYFCKMNLRNSFIKYLELKETKEELMKKFLIVGLGNIGEKYKTLVIILVLKF